MHSEPLGLLGSPTVHQDYGIVYLGFQFCSQCHECEHFNILNLGYFILNMRCISMDIRAKKFDMREQFSGDIVYLSDLSIVVWVKFDARIDAPVSSVKKQSLRRCVRTNDGCVMRKDHINFYDQQSGLIKYHKSIVANEFGNSYQILIFSRYISNLRI